MSVVGKGRMLVVSALVMLATLWMLAAVGRAAEPWWHVNAVSAPASHAGGENQVLLEVSDLGDAAVNGAVEPVSIVDHLPPGVTPTQVGGAGGGSFPVGVHGVHVYMKCGIAGQEVSCSYNGPLLAYERFMIPITVEVEPGAGTGVSEVSVTGGGAPPLTWRHALALDDTPAGFGAQNYELTPEEEGGAPTTQAGSHPFQLTSTVSFDAETEETVKLSEPGVTRPEVVPVGFARDLRFTLPPGLVGNPTPLPKCPLAVFVKQATNCPNNTVIGVATPIITNNLSSFEEHVPLAVTVPLYNVEPSQGEPARFGFSTQVGPVVLDTEVPPDGGAYPVVVTTPDIPDDVGFIGAQVTFWGVPGVAAHDTARGTCLDQFEGKSVLSITRLETACPDQEQVRPFLIAPTSCTGPMHSSVTGDRWEDVGDFSAFREYVFSDLEGVPIGQDGCNRLSFEPSMKVTPSGSQASTPSGLSVDVHVEQEGGLAPDGLAESTVKDTTVTLPAGVTLNPAAADGLAACTPQEIELESGEEQKCPEASKVGIVSIFTPLLPNPLKGAVYLAAQEDNPFDSLLALYIVVYDPVSGVRVKLAGEVKPNLETGQLVTTFKNTPQLPFEDLVLEFFGGSRAPLSTPPLCGAYSASAEIAPWSGNPAAQISTSPFQITSGANGISCQTSQQFAPSFTSGSLNLQAGGTTPFTMTMSRGDGEQNLDGITLKMPQGLSGLLSNVELCPEGQADEGECGAGSLIGETTVSVGVGSTPYTVTGGKVYLTGPYEGAPFGLSIVNPAKAGPFDLEDTKAHHPKCDCLLVRAKIEVNPVTAALTVTSDASGPYSIPTILEGIPLQIKHVNVTINRPSFVLNPTDCEPTQIGGDLASAQGATSALSVRFQVTNCAGLSFKPTFTASTSGKTSKRFGASLTAKLSFAKDTYGKNANIREVKVSLPKQLPARQETLTKACLSKVFDQNPASCPADARIGTAVANTPLIPVPLRGPAYFVSYGGAQFPEIVIVLQGYGVTIDLHGETFITNGIITSTFHEVPDEPVGSFELTLPEGPYSALSTFANLCHPTKSVKVRRKVTVEVKGHRKTVIRSVSKRVRAALTMPATFVAQNGTTIQQSTPIAVTGCAKPALKSKGHKRKG